jgi:hypothetical protein
MYKIQVLYVFLFKRYICRYFTTMSTYLLQAYEDNNIPLRKIRAAFDFDGIAYM